MTATENPASKPDDEATDPNGGRTIAVLGEMLELGDEAVEAHSEVGRMAGQYGIDMLIGVGDDLVKQTALYAGAAGVPAIALVADNDTAAAYLDSILRPGDKVIVKASRSGQLWQVARRLTGQPVTGFW
ncbi:UDP-N-acetylmuramoylalanyl-D-glutamate--2,6-diaminopimelate ligase [Streptomyces sp. NPDC091278]|uniref:glutamate ligase domain-containing protein n=1 Tax=Streptomyces sp. NPDC091278 TaxID=3155301 RepID=UPI00344B1A2A